MRCPYRGEGRGRPWGSGVRVCVDGFGCLGVRNRNGQDAGGYEDGTEVVHGHVLLSGHAGIEGFVGELAGPGGEVGDQLGGGRRLPQRS